ncbi:MAG: GNAT family protein [Alphaproteobacteria bacterium]
MNAPRPARRAVAFAPVPDGWSARPPARAPLAGRHVRLEPLDPAAHGDALFAAGQAPGADATWDYMGAGPFAARGPFDAFLATYPPLDDPLMLAVVDRATGQAAGMAAFMDIRPAQGGIEIGHIWLSPALQRTRAATEALFLMMAHAMEDLGYLRLQWKCNALNAPSRRAALRLGFRYEGTLHAHMLVKGRVRDTAFFSILAEEWPDIAARIRAWLDDANFDAAGRQIQALSRLMDAPAG